MERASFRETCLDRDDGTCVVPWCKSEADDVHHVIERTLWDDGGYVRRNGASVCNTHHLYAESNDIPPQAFWRWTGEEPLTPDGLPTNIDKWGDEFEQPPWKEHRERIKYPSTGHLPFSPEWDDSRVDFREVEPLVTVPVVLTVKLDGSNAMLVKDTDEPVRARNGSHAEHPSFDRLKQLYWDRNVYETLPEHLQIFGEWLYAKHSIHYGCDCDDPCEDIGPPLDGLFYVFGIFDTRFDLWLSWPEVTEWANELGFPTTPEVRDPPVEYIADHQFYDELPRAARRIVSEGHEGIIVRSQFPFHYGQFERRVAKYVRDGHVDPDADHWSHREIVRNRMK